MALPDSAVLIYKKFSLPEQKESFRHDSSRTTVKSVQMGVRNRIKPGSQPGRAAQWGCSQNVPLALFPDILLTLPALPPCKNPHCPFSSFQLFIALVILRGSPAQAARQAACNNRGTKPAQEISWFDWDLCAGNLLLSPCECWGTLHPAKPQPPQGKSSSWCLPYLFLWRQQLLGELSAPSPSVSPGCHPGQQPTWDQRSLACSLWKFSCSLPSSDELGVEQGICGYCTAKGSDSRSLGRGWGVFHGISKAELLLSLLALSPLNSKRLLHGHSGDKGRLNRRA